MEFWLWRKQSLKDQLFKGKECKHVGCYFPFNEDNLFDYKKKNSYFEIKSLHDDNNNSFYGYIYNNIIQHTNDTIGLFMGYTSCSPSQEDYPIGEWPPAAFTYKEFEEALLRWRKACSCDTTKNK